MRISAYGMGHRAATEVTIRPHRSRRARAAGVRLAASPRRAALIVRTAKSTPPPSMRARTSGRSDPGGTVANASELRHIAADLPELGEDDSLSALTERERDIMDEIARGATNGETAPRLFLAEPTVKTSVGRILAELRLRDRVHIVIRPTRQVSYDAGDKPDSVRADHETNLLWASDNAGT